MKNNKEYFYIAVIIVLVAALAYMAAAGSITGRAVSDNKDAAAEKVRSIYSILAENDTVRVVAVSEESGIYRVSLSIPLRNGQNVLQDVFVTKDGNFVTDRIINSTAYETQLKKEKAFGECLASKNVIVAGISNEANTMAQLQLLGSFAYKVFVDCSGANQQICESAGIQRVPTTIIGNDSIIGVQPLTYFEGATGCVL